MMVFGDNPQALVGDIKLSVDIAAFLNRFAHADIVEGFFGHLLKGISERSIKGGFRHRC